MWIPSCENEGRSAVSDSLWPQGLYSPWNFHVIILQWVAFPFSRGSSQPRDWTQVSRIAGRFLSHNGNSRTLEWVTYPFSSGSSWPRTQTGVSCIAGGFFTNWAIREALIADLNPVGSLTKAISENSLGLYNLCLPLSTIICLIYKEK